ncbi:MAG: hypothetical protein U0790_06795 [Isosphaeraceae bacterium]
MRCDIVLLVGVALCLGSLPPAAHAQKGGGEDAGVARQAVKPEVVTLTGKLVEIRTGPCEATTGRSAYGTHIVVDVPERGRVDVHLGPASKVAESVAKMPVGQEITVDGFRTRALKPDQYIARTLRFGSETIELRDASLRPVWAGSDDGPVDVRRGPGFGRGHGWGPGGRRGQGAGQGGGLLVSAARAAGPPRGCAGCCGSAPGS